VPSVGEHTDPYIAHYRRVPFPGPGVCNVCHGAPGGSFSRCYSCTQTIGQVIYGLELVVPISLGKKTDSQFYTTLMGYKSRYVSTARDQQRYQMAALYARFLHRHRPHIVEAAGEDWEVITIVPSSGQREGPHPLEITLGLSKYLKPQYKGLLKKGTATISHNKADNEGYDTTEDVTEKRVLLIDDTFTTGARVQSAASALALGGATVVAAVVAARIISPDFSDESRELWEQAGEEPFSFDTCCLEGNTWFP
jgi:predicted amidophosphoribosyltransferase